MTGPLEHHTAKIAEYESQVRQLEARNASTASELRISRDSEKALRERVAELEAERDDVESDGWSRLRERVDSLTTGQITALIAEQGQAVCLHCQEMASTTEEHWRVCPKHPAREALAASEARVYALVGLAEKWERERGPADNTGVLNQLVGRCARELREALAAAVPPEKSPDVELYEAQERFVDARRAAAVPQPPRDPAWISVASEEERERIADMTSEQLRSLEGPAVPQREPEMGELSGPRWPSPTELRAQLDASEAPPAGEPTPGMAEALEEAMHQLRDAPKSARLRRLRFLLAAQPVPASPVRDESPVPMLLHCPECRTRHIDVGEFATKVHHTHSCQICGLTWRPAVGPTVGVQFLPGFKNADAPTVSREVDEAAVRASERARIADWLDGLASLAPMTNQDDAHQPTLRRAAAELRKRPAASGKDGAT